MRRVHLLFLLVFCILAAAGVSQADEGMWQPHQLPELGDTLADLGLQIDPGRLTDLTAHPMNAVISLGGCTASFVSPQGLVVTNHHCAYRSIQYNSTEENNLIENGFLAQSGDEELFAGPGSRVLVTVAVQDVTQKMLGGLSEELGGLERYQAIEDRRKGLVADCEKDEGHRCSVRSVHGGLEYYLYKALEIRDVRLVYAPARGVGNYGGDVDNWQWPRHTGDFSFFRAYVGKNGKPADHDESNVPFHPPHHLKVAAQGLAPGDLVLVAGYPGTTNRYRLASEVENQFRWYYPSRKALLEKLLEIVERETAERPDAAIKYAGLVAGVNNATKNYGGMLQGFASGNMLQRKGEQEAALRAWAEKDPAERGSYVEAMQTLEQLVAESEAARERDLYLGVLGRGSAMFSSARTLYRLSKEKQKPDAEREPGYQQRDLRRIEERMTRLNRSYDPRVERAVLRQILLGYAGIPADQHIPALDQWFGIDGTGVDEAALERKLDEMYAATKLGDLEQRMRWLEATPKQFEKSEDPFIQLAVAIYPEGMRIERQEKDLSGRLNQVRPLYMKGLIALRSSQGEPIYPDANSTLRVTYGTVQGYSPRDGVFYTPFTSVDGIVEKETGEAPFDSPPALLEAVKARRFGGYAIESLGSVPVDYLSNVDTTGGNSGSPTLNGRGELVGLLFDGVWESIISDWDFLPARTRSIHVDIRYALWVMSEVDHADRLLREMGVAESGGE